MIIRLWRDQSVIFGLCDGVTFAPTDRKGNVGIERMQDGHHPRDGTWVGARWLSGDETHQGTHVHLYDGTWTAQRAWLYGYFRECQCGVPSGKLIVNG
jgi:hypothetical protein